MIRDIATLIKNEYIQDEYGREQPSTTSTEVFVSEIYYSEATRFDTGVDANKPDLKLMIRRYEYNGEQEMEYKGKKYQVIRIFSNGYEDLEVELKSVIKDES